MKESKKFCTNNVGLAEQLLQVLNDRTRFLLVDAVLRWRFLGFIAI